jgi:hypothetical protein
MRFLLIVLLVTAFVSCKESSVISKQLAGSDSLEINFNEPGTNNISKTVIATEYKAIKKLAGFVDSKETEAYQCGYDGNLMFYKEGKLVGNVAFNYSGDGCHHFILMFNNLSSTGVKTNNLFSTAMSNEAVDFLKSLAEGKGWY